MKLVVLTNKDTCPRCGVELTYSNRSSYTDLAWNTLCNECVRK